MFIGPLRSLGTGLFLHFLCVYSAHVASSPPSFSSSPFRYSLLRVLCGCLAIYYLFDFALQLHKLELRRGLYLCIDTIAMHYSMRVIDTCFVSLWDGERPQWVAVPQGQIATGNTHVTEPPTPPQAHSPPAPTILRDIIIFYMDLICSCRGPSWFPDRVWSWAPKSVLSSISNTPPTTRSQFLTSNTLLLIYIYLALDVIETYVGSQHWDYSSSYPVTSLPIPQQIIFSISVFLSNLCQFSLVYILNATISVTLGSSPTSWPLMFVSPLSASSLGRFWADGWHQNYSRGFVRTTQGLLYLIPDSVRTRYPRATIIIRRILVFSFSAAFHLYLFYTLPTVHNLPQPPFLDPSALRFFLSQPLGLILESVLVVPLAELLGCRAGARRVFAWAWLLWTGRWYSDVWISRGMYEPFLVSLGAYGGVNG